jgi:hypothetical protein
MNKLKRVLSSDLNNNTTNEAQRQRTESPAMKPSESVQCLSDNIVLLESEVKVIKFKVSQLFVILKI